MQLRARIACLTVSITCFTHAIALRQFGACVFVAGGEPLFARQACFEGVQASTLRLTVLVSSMGNFNIGSEKLRNRVFVRNSGHFLTTRSNCLAQRVWTTWKSTTPSFRRFYRLPRAGFYGLPVNLPREWRVALPATSIFTQVDESISCFNQKAEIHYCTSCAVDLARSLCSSSANHCMRSLRYGRQLPTWRQVRAVSGWTWVRNFCSEHSDIRRTRPREAVEEKAYSGDLATVAGLIEGKASLADVESLAQRQAHPALPASRSLFPVHFCEPPPGVLRLVYIKSAMLLLLLLMVRVCFAKLGCS